MKAARRLILPALVAGPAVMWMFGLMLIGWPGFTRFTLVPEFLLLWVGLVGFALLVFGWPVAALLARLRVPAPLRLLLIVAAGIAGGGLFAAAVAGGTGAMVLGLVPGAVTAAIWSAFNTDLVGGRTALGTA
ncbi:MAG TPA: hypothetical protein VF652_00230 [Allosphingosinicella sp.]